MHASTESPLPVFAWHAAVEEHLQAGGVPAVVLQPAFFMSNLLEIAGGIATTDTVFAPSGGAKVAMVDVRDVGAVAAAVLAGSAAPSTEPITITGPEAITFDDVARAIGRATGRPVRSVDLTPEEARPRFENAAFPPWMREHLAGVFQLIRDGEFARTTDAVPRLTGRPGTTIDTFASDHAAVFAPRGRSE